MGKKIDLNEWNKNSKHIERNGKKLATVIIGEDAYSDDEYIIYNGDYSFQSKVVFSNQDRKLPDDQCALESGYTLFDFIWEGDRIPKNNVKQKIMRYVERALENDIKKAGIEDIDIIE